MCKHICSSWSGIYMFMSLWLGAYIFMYVWSDVYICMCVWLGMYMFMCVVRHVYVHVCVIGCLYVHVFWHMGATCWSQMSFSVASILSFWDKIFHTSSGIWLERLTSKLQKSTCLCFPGTRATSECYCARLSALGFGVQTRVLMIVRQTLDQHSHPPVLVTVFLGKPTTDVCRQPHTFPSSELLTLKAWSSSL